MKRGYAKALTAPLLYALGLAHWVVFLDFGRIPLDGYDWPREAAYLALLKEAIVSLKVPLYHSGGIQSTTMFLGIPDSTLSPDVLLAAFLPPAAFFVAHVLAMYSIGFLATMALARERGWPPLALTAFFLIFNFNGNVTSHIAVGHLFWTGYFVIPLFILFSLRWVERGATGREAAGISLAVLAMSLLGAFHMAVWCFIFTALVGIRRQRWLAWSLATLGLGAALTAFRWLPTIAVFRRHGWPWAEGYSSLGQVVSAMAIRFPPETRVPGAMAWWEYDMYVGFAGLALIAAWGLAPVLRAAWPGSKDPKGYLLLPLAVLLLLPCRGSFFSVFPQIPLIGVERVATRMFILPLLFLAALGCERLAAMFGSRGRSRGPALAGAAVLVLLAAELLAHSWTWKIGSLPAWPAAGGAAPRLIGGSDGGYELAVAAGWGGSMAALILTAAYLLYRRPTALRRFRRSPRASRW